MTPTNAYPKVLKARFFRFCRKFSAQNFWALFLLTFFSDFFFWRKVGIFSDFEFFYFCCMMGCNLNWNPQLMKIIIVPEILKRVQRKDCLVPIDPPETRTNLWVICDRSATIKSHMAPTWATKNALSHGGGGLAPPGLLHVWWPMRRPCWTITKRILSR